MTVVPVVEVENVAVVIVLVVVVPSALRKLVVVVVGVEFKIVDDKIELSLVAVPNKGAVVVASVVNKSVVDPSGARDVLSWIFVDDDSLLCVGEVVKEVLRVTRVRFVVSSNVSLLLSRESGSRLKADVHEDLMMSSLSKETQML